MYDIFLPEVSKQLWRQSSKYLHSYNILLLAKYFLFKNKMCFRVGGDIPNKVYLGGEIDHMVRLLFFIYTKSM